LRTDYEIFKTLLYFDLFDYPLTKNEIFRFLEQKTEMEDLTRKLQQLILEKKIWQLDEFYSLQNNQKLVERRRTGNARAGIFLNKATWISRLLSQFPYVRAIGISGSVSKNYADEYADIDYFIITKTNRLWIARTLMHLYKKLPFIKDRKKFYCMNYYIDESELQIEEQNIYTATELVTMMPMYGNGSIDNFYAANQWALIYFPNLQLQGKKYQSKSKDHWVKIMFEAILNNKIGDWLDNYFFRLTTKRWKLKEEQGRLNTKGERMGLKTSKHCSKPNPIFFHNSFMNRYEHKLEEMKQKWNTWS
jgi:hypothetical protein